ncbi:MAG: phosphoadenylyl-sulfate reductase, partial [Chloroflexi bacterium]|nr:phosphoadenylyl-sulfate reductase [Chloroflexota bacterium]
MNVPGHTGRPPSPLPLGEEIGTQAAVLTPEEVADLNRRFESAAPPEILAWALQRFGPRVALASSFGAEDVVLIDMLWRLDPGARVFTLDTLRLPTETNDLLDEVRQRYGTRVEILYPAIHAVDQMVQERGYNCFYRSVASRQICCGVRKVEPLDRALGGLDAWITGLRRDQAVTRGAVQTIELDGAHGGIVKLNPLAGWSHDAVWSYIRQHDVPYNKLHERGYPSIGCAPCTRAVQPGEDPRAGRWWWELDPA